MTPLARRLLLLLVFVAGMASLGIEFAASRLLAPFFGASLYVWGVLIGLILIYLSAGYVLGGRLADRQPRPDLLYQLTAWAGLWVGLIPVVSHPILLASLQGFATLSVGLVLSTLLGAVALFAVPVVLLGCVSPFAIRLLLKDVESGGNTAGAVYALSTAGSILGTFLPVFWFIPSYGTRATLIGFSVALLLLSLVGLWPRKKPYLLFLPVVLVAWLALPPGIKPPAAGRLVYEHESAYNYIQVVQVGPTRELILNEGQAIHSVYDPGSYLTGLYWDYLLLAPEFRPDEPAAPPQRVAFLGLAGGTSARQYAAAYGPNIRITGVEIDRALVGVARRYFGLTEPEVHPVVQDARYWLETTGGHYDVIVVDAYQQPYIPFYLTTKEFFELVRGHLTPSGSVAVNVGRTQTDYRLVAAVASTMRTVYPDVFLLDPPGTLNTIVYGTNTPTTLPDVIRNLRQVRAPLAQPVAATALAEGDIRVSPYRGQVFTDDIAPVERLIDTIIFDYATGRDRSAG